MKNMKLELFFQQLLQVILQKIAHKEDKIVENSLLNLQVQTDEIFSTIGIHMGPWL